MSAGFTPERSTAALAASAPRSIADTSVNTPVYRAIGVRAPATITTSLGNMSASQYGFSLDAGEGLQVAPILGQISGARYAQFFRYHRVATAFAGLFHGEFSPINQVGHDVFAFIILLRRSFHDS